MKRSLRTLLGLMLAGGTAYATIVFGGFVLRAASRTAALREAAAPLQAELARLDAQQQQLDSLAVLALNLEIGDSLEARELSTRRPEEEGAAVGAQRRVVLPGEIRTALAQMAPAESELLVRIREVTAAVEAGRPESLSSAREDLLETRAGLANATRRVELLTLQDLSAREAALDEELRIAQRFLAIAGVIGLVLVALGYRFLDRRLLKPIEEIGRAVEDVEGGDLDRSLTISSEDELGQIATLFNRMTGTLRRRQEEESRIREKIAAELKQSEDLLQQIVNQAREIILVLELDGTIVFAGPAWASLANMPRVPEGRRFDDLLDSTVTYEFRTAFEEAARGEEARISLPLERREEGLGSFEFIFSRLELEEGRILAVGRDVTEAMAEEERQRRSSRLEAVGQLTGGVAHDFNNLLTVIRGNLDLLRSVQVDAGEDVHKIVTAMIHASDRAAGLTQSLLAFSRKQTLRASAMDLGDAVRRTVTLLDRILTEEAELRLQLPDEPIPVELDRSQLESAVVNLCINARDAMPRGGTIWVEVSEDLIGGTDAERLELETGPYAVLTVRDDGTGMTPDVLAKALEPFFTTKEVGQGSGLGLSMVYGFARQSGGACTIVSKPGVGTTVTLYFPLVADAIAELAQPVTGAPPEGDGTRILVVEDDPDVRFIVVEMLRDLGYEVEEVESAVEGLERVKRGAFGLVFSDVVLPGGMDGAELGREIRSIRPELPVLLTSGYPREALADREGIESVELLPKPFDRATLAEAISRALEAGTTPGT